MNHFYGYSHYMHVKTCSFKKQVVCGKEDIKELAKLIIAVIPNDTNVHDI